MPAGPALVLGGALPVLAVALTFADGTAIATGTDRLVFSAAFNIVFYAALLHAGLHLAGRRSFSIVYGALVAYTAIYLFAYTYHFVLYDQLVGESSINAVIDSNPQELTEFLAWAVSPEHLPLPLAVALAAALVLVLGRPAVPSRRSRRAGLAGLAVVALMLPVAAIKTNVILYNPAFFAPHAVYQSLAHRRAVAKILTSVEGIAVGAVEGPAEEAVTHVLVIGESTTRRHMSLYGYARETTPRLGGLAPELDVVRNACSSRGVTITALQEMLTFATREDRAPLYEKPNLLQIAKAAGFRSWWLSNQSYYGEFDNWSMVLSRPADTRHFVNRVGEGTSYDEGLLPHLRAALADPAPRKLVVLHLLGAHADYTLRYPAGFARFDGQPLPPTPRLLTGRDAARFNAYDNAVLYNDTVVAEIIEAARAAGGRATVTYLSDHGEALGEISDFVTHIDGRAPRQVYEIPLVFWMSPDFRADAAPRLADLPGNLDRPFQSDDLIHTALDLYGIRHAGRDRNRSLLSATYRDKARFCDGLPGAPEAVDPAKVARAE
jgi:heptose-I-phosphate ethanolaminephosphotransferase